MRPVRIAGVLFVQEREPRPPEDIKGARVLLLLGDSVTTDHISPAGSIARNSPAARYLAARGLVFVPSCVGPPRV